jgi:hypothetical protein
MKGGEKGQVEFLGKKKTGKALYPLLRLRKFKQHKFGKAGSNSSLFPAATGSCAST